MVHIVGRGHVWFGKLSEMDLDGYDCFTIAEQLKHEVVGVEQ